MMCRPTARTMVPSVGIRSAALTVLPVSLVVFATLRRFIVKKQRRPPGPLPLPLLGNALSIDAKEPWLTYTKWRATYGDLVFLRILDQEVVVINSEQIAQDLLDKRSRIYSDRPYIATLEPFGWSAFFFAIGYNDEWRLSRRLFHQTFRPKSALKFRPMQIRQAHEMIVNLIEDPKHFDSHFATFSSSVVISAVYDYEPRARDDPVVKLAANALHFGLSVMTPERAMMLKALPFLMKLPDWCWGSSIKRDAQISTNRVNEMVNVPFQYAKRRMADDPLMNQSSMVVENLQLMKKQDEAFKPKFETALKKAASSAFGGAFETTSSLLMVFTLAMVLYPDVQKRAQAEIDFVIGKDRLPTFEDRKSLPYIEAVLRETLRWNPILPLGLPHATSSADIYNGYFIPKGAIVMCNTWAISQDEKRYPEPSRFMPERFIKFDGALTDDDPAEYIFGLGRRICPGRATGEASAWSAIVTMLATVNISYGKDEEGNVIGLEPEFTRGLTRRPIAFPCSILARSGVHSEFLLNALRTDAKGGGGGGGGGC